MLLPCGTSVTAYAYDGQFGVCSQNCEILQNDEDRVWRYMLQNGIQTKLLKYQRSIGNIAIQGEFCGVGIQNNRLTLKEDKWYIFNILFEDAEVKGKWRKADFGMLGWMSNDIGLEMVPIEEVGDSFAYDVQDLLIKAKGKYPSGKEKEGIVVRTQMPSDSESASFKVLNNDFLLKEK